MSRFFSPKNASLEPYTPGEQPGGMEYVKLNTNESPFPPSERATAYAMAHTRPMNLYSDPEMRELRAVLAEAYRVSPDEVILTNGSDEILNYAMAAFCDDRTPAAFADVTYGFYPVIAKANHVPYTEIPLQEDFSIRVEDFFGIGKTIFIANPNAPTGKLLPVREIERVIRNNPDNVVVVDEAYIDFGGESCVPLVRTYENLLVTQTFSKSRSMAGARLGFGVASKGLIADLNTVRNAQNPYNINSMTAALAIGTLRDADYTRKNCETIIETRAYTTEQLRRRGFTVLDSAANFVFATTEQIGGGALYEALKRKGVLVRHFTKQKICDYNRITIGTRAQMDALLRAIDEIIAENA